MADNGINDETIDIDFPNCLEWTYIYLYKKYKQFLEDSAGVLLMSKLENFTSWTCSTPCYDITRAGMTNDPDDAVAFLTKIGRYLTILLADEAYNFYKDIRRWTTERVTKRDVLIWAVIMNKKKFAIEILQKEDNSIYAALFASAMFKALSTQADDEGNIELGRSFKENSSIFEMIACHAMAKMYSKDRAMSQNLLTQPVGGYGLPKKTVMKISANNALMQFMGTTPCQTKLNSIWNENVARFTSKKKIIACIFVPFLIPCIKFMAHNREISKRSPFSTIKFFGLTSKEDAKISLPYALYCFYNAPVTKFWTNLIAYFMMLCCFSFFVLTDLHHLSDEKLSSMEIFILFWTSTMLLEEVRQIVQREQITLWYKIRSWWRDPWNKFDATMYTLYVLSVILRTSLTKEHFQWARMTYSITLATFILRMLHFFYVSKITGPKIIMIGKMVADLQFFVTIYTVVLVSFGVIMQANLYPNSEPKLELLKSVVYLPYWQMYGELFLETIEGQETAYCTTDPFIYKTGSLPRCPVSNALLPFVLAVYMVITSIMLVNLLIAMFSDTYQKVQENSVLIWKYYRYSLVYEYYERPVIVPPLIIVNHVYRIIQYMVNKWCDSQCFDNINLFEEQILDGKTPKMITEAERKAMDEILTHTLIRWHCLSTRSNIFDPLTDDEYD